MADDDEVVELPAGIKRVFEDAADVVEEALDRITTLEAFVLKLFSDHYEVAYSLTDGWVDSRYDFTDEERQLVLEIRKSHGLDDG
jgi:hypothetical protein